MLDIPDAIHAIYVVEKRQNEQDDDNDCMSVPETTPNFPVSTGSSDLVMQAASILYANGQTTHRVVRDAGRLAQSRGLDIEILAQWDSLLCRFRPLGQSDAMWQTSLVTVQPLGVDMNKVAQATAAIEHSLVLRERDSDSCVKVEPRTEVAPDPLAAELGRIQALAPSRLVRFALMCAVGASSLGLVFGVSSALVLLLIALTALVGAVVRRWLAALSGNTLVQPFAAALIAGAAGGAAHQVMGDPALQFVALAPCMILVPGAHILNASLDLLRSRLGLGLARMAYSVLILLSICAGLLIGLLLVQAPLAISAVAAQTSLVTDIIAAGLAVSAFGTFFSMPWRLLAVPVTVGMVCHALHWLAMSWGADVALAALLACALAGTLSAVASRYLDLPFAALAFASVVSMMPGVFVFELAGGLSQLYRDSGVAAASLTSAIYANGMTALLVIMAMTFGLIVPKMLLDPFFDRHAP